MRFAAWLLLLCCILTTAHAEETKSLHAIAVNTGDEIVLDDQRILHLEGIKAPNKDQQDLATQARNALQTIIKDKALTLDKGTIDRYGRVNAQAYALDDKNTKIWLQGEMLKAGMAFVFPPTGTENHLDEMLKAEADARQQSRGIWADAAYVDIPADQVDDHIGGYGFVRGKVLKAVRVKNKFYLNFGEDWHHDFTIAIAAHDLKNFRQANIDPATYEGKNIRVRGWIIRDNGPMIVVTGPAQIELVQ